MIQKLYTYQEAYTIIKNNKILIYPTETFYAIGTSIFSNVIPEIYTIKQRNINKPLPVIMHSLDAILTFVKEISDIEKEIFTLFPHITLILPLEKPIFAQKEKTIAIRIASTPFLQYITQQHPIISTSANISQEPPCALYKDIHSTIKERSPIYIPTVQADIPKGTAPSTIIHVKNNILHILREGNVSIKNLSNANFSIKQ